MKICLRKRVFDKLSACRYLFSFYENSHLASNSYTTFWTNVPLMRIGNLPVIPRPITESATVNHVCLNFENVRKQLNQLTMPVWCDEGVFDILIDVILSNPAQFSHIFAVISPFHWSKIIQKCCGKFLRGAGLEDALVECGTFGPGAIETVLMGNTIIDLLLDS